MKTGRSSGPSFRDSGNGGCFSLFFVSLIEWSSQPISLLSSSGLQLKAARGRAEVLVIDHGERPPDGGILDGCLLKDPFSELYTHARLISWFPGTLTPGYASHAGAGDVAPPVLAPYSKSFDLAWGQRSLPIPIEAGGSWDLAQIHLVVLHLKLEIHLLVGNELHHGEYE